MRLHRFFIPNPLEHTCELIKDERLIHQWRDVFRYNVGSEVILFDGSGTEYDSVIEKLNNREAAVRLVSQRKGVIPQKKVSLFQSLIKKDKMEWSIEKATELGVSAIIPVISERSENKGLNMERAKKIAIEASEQCGRADVPEIGEIVGLEEALRECANPIVFDPSGDDFVTLADYSQYSIFIGPEGGWSEKELNLFRQKEIPIFSLGNLILRAETAVVAAITKLI